MVMSGWDYLLSGILKQVGNGDVREGLFALRDIKAGR